MVQGRAHYVQAIKHAFPNARKLVSGPFDRGEQADQERRRLQTEGLYPDADLRSVVHRAATLPERKPRTVPPGGDAGRTYDLSTRPGRERLADDLAAHAKSLGAAVVVENWDGEPDVDLALPNLRANVWCVSVQGELPIISWHGASEPLKAVVPGAWGETGQTALGGGRKATSEPRSWAQLFEMLEAGICASLDGTAFEG